MFHLIGPIAVVFLAWFWYSGRPVIRRNGSRLRRPPNTLPLLGNGLLFLRSRNKLFHWFVKCERIFGFETFEISVPTLPPGVVINDPMNLEYVLKNDEIFTKGEFFRKRSWDLFGHGIINADGDLWRLQRKAGLRFFNHTQLRGLVDVDLPQHFAKMRTSIRKYAENGKVADLDSIFLDFTTGLMGKIAYDMNMTASHPFSRAFDYASGAIGERFQNPLWRVTELLTGWKLRRAFTEVRKFGRAIVANAFQKRKEGHIQGSRTSRSSGDGIVKGSLINSFIDGIEDPQIVADAALNFLSAGRDTTAQALTWTFYLLTRHPAAVDGILTELSNIYQTNGGRLDFSNPDLSFTSRGLPYTTAVFLESLRLYPPVPFEIKQTESPTTLPDGTFLPKSSIVVWCTWAINRSHRIWDKDADEFRPERWLELDVNSPRNWRVVTKTAFEWPVFNGGPRTCLGQKMAELLGVYVIARLVWEFEFLAVGKAERVSKMSLTLPMEEGLPCRMKKRVERRL